MSGPGPFSNGQNILESKKTIYPPSTYTPFLDFPQTTPTRPTIDAYTYLRQPIGVFVPSILYQ